MMEGPGKARGWDSIRSPLLRGWRCWRVHCELGKDAEGNALRLGDEAPAPAPPVVEPTADEAPPPATEDMDIEDGLDILHQGPIGGQFLWSTSGQLSGHPGVNSGADSGVNYGLKLGTTRGQGGANLDQSWAGGARRAGLRHGIMDL